MDKDTTIGLTAEKLAQLLALHFDPELGTGQDDRSETAGQLLEAYLANTSIVAAAGQGSGNLAGAPGGGPPRSLGEVLTDPRSSLETLTEIKRYAKKRAAQQASEAEQAVVTTIYFAAVASGLVVHQRKLTTTSYEDLYASLSELLEKPWMSPKLRGLLENARRVCRARSS
ncbi:MAG: hypothetical protein MUC88_23665 [Planctomycetes bacterium]|jgi:hypothetical protein|nr:hypothetical protein [Planctomycetota bacterium]